MRIYNNSKQTFILNCKNWIIARITLPIYLLKFKKSIPKYFELFSNINYKIGTHFKVFY